jgi:hypothetical protein
VVQGALTPHKPGSEVSWIAGRPSVGAVARSGGCATAGASVTDNGSRNWKIGESVRNARVPRCMECLRSRYGVSGLKPPPPAALPALCDPSKPRTKSPIADELPRIDRRAEMAMIYETASAATLVVLGVRRHLRLCLFIAKWYDGATKRPQRTEVSCRGGVSETPP